MVKNKLKTLLYGVIIMSLVGVTIFSYKHSDEKIHAAQNGRAEFLSRVSNGLAETNIQTLRVNPPVAIESLSTAIQLRAGVEFSSTTKVQLAELETKAIGDAEQLISVDKLVDVLTTTALEQFGKLTDSEIKNLISIQRGFTAPDLPSEIKNDIAIFPGHYVQMSDEEAFKQLKAFGSPQAQLVIKPFIKNKIEEQLVMHLANYASASPEVFGENWDKTTASPGKPLTISQAMLLTYSIVSGDSFADTTVELTKKMLERETILANKYGNFPSSAKHKAFGQNGYLYSSATNIFFNEKTQTLILNKLSEEN